MSESDAICGVEYRPIPGFPAHRVGSDGSVWSCLMRVNDRNGRLSWVPTDNWRRSRTFTAKYERVYLGNRKSFTVHGLVAAAFIGPRPSGLQVNHINGIKSDNRSVNLEYVTQMANVRHASKHGLVRQKRNGGLSGTQQKKSGRWQSRVQIGGVIKFLGTFDTEEQAHLAYIEARR